MLKIHIYICCTSVNEPCVSKQLEQQKTLFNVRFTNIEQSLSLYKLFTVFRRVILDVDMLGHFKDRSLPS